jgi:hypothetical protein
MICLLILKKRENRRKQKKKKRRKTAREDEKITKYSLKILPSSGGKSNPLPFKLVI